MRRRWAAVVHNFLRRLARQQPHKSAQRGATRVIACCFLPLKAGCFVPEARGKRANRLLGATLHGYGSIILIRNYDNIMVSVNQHNIWVTLMAQLMTNFEWGTLKSGFAPVDGVFLPIHPRRSRGEASFVSSYGAIVGNDYRLPFDEPLRFIAPTQLADRKEATLLAKGLSEASEAQFAMAELEHRRYAPSDAQTGLFRDFADLRSEADIIAFANRFGPLGADLSLAIVDVVPEEPWKRGIVLYWAEPLKLWRAEARAMACVVGLSDLIQAGDQSVFAARLTRTTARLRIEKGSSGVKNLEKDWVIAKKADNPERFQKIAELDVKDWPALLLAQWLESGLRGRTDFGVSGTVAGLAPTMTPNGLIGALWLQAALAISGKVDFLQCRECRTWFEVSTRDARPDKRFCGNACRMRAYRQRKKDRETS
jgi:hypothetical protein